MEGDDDNEEVDEAESVEEEVHIIVIKWAIIGMERATFISQNVVLYGYNYRGGPRWFWIWYF